MMEVHAAGFNAWNQLRFQEPPPPSSGNEEPEDLHEFACVLADGDHILGDVASSLSYTLGE